MPRLTDKELAAVIAGTTEAVLNEKGFTKVLNKLKFSEKEPDEMSKEEKTCKYFLAKMDNNRSEIAKYCGGVAKDLNGNTSGSGLELLPTEFHSDIIDRVKSDPIALRNKCTLVPVVFRNGTWPIGVTGVNLTWENSDTNPLTPTSPTFSSLAYSVTRLDGYTALARDLMEDTPVSLYEYLTKQYAKAFVKAENLAIMVGTGTLQPQGIINAVGLNIIPGINAATTNVLHCDDMVSLPFAIDVNWRDGGVYYMNTGAVRQAKLFKDLQGRYLWVNGDVQAGKPATFNGYPVQEFTALFPENLTVNAKATCSEMVFGNLEYFYLFDKGEMGSELNTQSDEAFKTHSVLVKMWERIDGKASIGAAFALLTGFLK
ncbi:phage major capsid protein [Clostridium estertheticum]|uniref:phage major capsid protein n=1 Tax=Clostridium estertheticum TaxID=238834 RepID=UPI00124F258A|nr:phage major capsid protein [Clostridium estertheticum]MBZ9615303.1 phage major capsid protein [Clostridium estertheticum subsp. laramiense]WAG75192.1 phage major capsid protein [Clostridium estertheticum]